METPRIDRGATLARGEIGEGLPIEDGEHGVADVDHDVPEGAGRFVGTGTGLVVAEGDTGQGSEGAVEETNDSPDRNAPRIGGEAVAAVGAEARPDESGVLEDGEDLLEELRWQIVPLGEDGERNGALRGVPNEVNERPQTVLRACREPHVGNDARSHRRRLGGGVPGMFEHAYET